MKLATNTWSLLKSAAEQWFADNPFQLSAAIAYYTLFSLTPLLSICIAIASLFYGRDAAQGQIVAGIGGIVGPETAKAIEATIRAANQEHNAGLLASVIGVAVLLIGASAVVAQLQESLNHIWGVKTEQRSSWLAFVKDRLFSFAVILGIGFLLIVSLVVTTVLSALTTHISGLTMDSGMLWQVVDGLVSISTLSVLFGLIYRLLPDAHVDWRDVIIGAVITSLLFTAGKFAIGFYLSQTTLASTYGAAGSLVTLLMWVYYSALIFFFGAEITQVFATQFGKGVIPTELGRVGSAERAASKPKGNFCG